MAKILVSRKELSNILRDDSLYEKAIAEISEDIIQDVKYTEEYNSKYLKDSKIKNGNFLTLLYIFKPLNVFKDEEIEKEMIFDPSNIDKYDTFFDRVIKNVSSKHESQSDIKKLMHSISWGLNELSKFSSLHVLKQRGISISSYDITRLAKKNPKFNETLNFTHAKDTSHLPNIQDKIAAQKKNAEASVDEILNDTDNNLRTLIKSGAGVNKNQLAEVNNNIGYKPDIRGKVITTPVDSSFAKGLTKVEDFNTDSIGARKALITSKTQVRQSGYLNRKISVLTEDYRISDTVDCGTKHFLRFTVKDKQHLKLIEMRYYMDEEGNSKIINIEDEWLIGKTINLRTPITCACEEGQVCHTCYGDLWKINNGKNIGTIANLILTEPMTQKLLSTKHTLTVEVKNFDWDDNFIEHFVINKNYIIPKLDSQVVYIDKEDLDERENYNVNRYTTERIFILDKKGNRIFMKAPVKLILPDTEFNSIDDFYIESEDAYEIKLSEMNNIEYMFKIIINNTGVADPLLKIKDALEKNFFIQEKADSDYNIIIQELVGLLIESKTTVMSIHLELIISCMNFFEIDRSLLKDPKTIIANKIYNISDAIYFCFSPIKSIMYQNSRKQLTTDNFNNVFDKDGNSEFDRFFVNF